MNCWVCCAQVPLYSMMGAPQPTSNIITSKGRTNRRYCRFALIDSFKMISGFFVIDFIFLSFELMLLALWINFAAPKLLLGSRWVTNIQTIEGNFTPALILAT